MSSAAVAQINWSDEARRLIYLKNPVYFAKQELGVEPSIDQAEFLMSCADLDKFYFIISAGRGAGKTWCVAWALCWAMAVLPQKFGKYEVTILAGSGEQAKNLYRVFKNACYDSPMLNSRLLSKPTKSMTEFQNGWVKVLTASEKSVRGPHPDMLIIDEVCAAENELIEVAMMQESGSGHGRIILLSTPNQMYGVFRDYWERAEEYLFEKVGPWPLTNCTWIPEWKIENWKNRFSPDFFKVEVLGEFATSRKSVFTHEWINDAYSHGAFFANPNYDVDIGGDWGGSLEHKTTQLIIQYVDGIVYVCGPEYVYTEERYPTVIEKIKDMIQPLRVATFYGDISHKGENERVEDLGVHVEMVKFATDKNRLVEILIQLFHHRQVHISEDLEVLRKELQRYEYAYTRTGKQSFRKVDDDTVDGVLFGIRRCLDVQSSMEGPSDHSKEV